jgi:hypothetical protein
MKALDGGWVVSYTLQPLCPRKEPRYPCNIKLGEPQSRSGRLVEDKISPPTGVRTPDHSAIHLVAIPTTLSPFTLEGPGVDGTIMIKWTLKVLYERVDWIVLAQDRAQW